MPSRNTVDGIPVELPDDIEAARQALERILGVGRIERDVSMLARQRLRVSFRAATTVNPTVNVGNRSYPVLPLTQVEGRVYWVACDMELNPELGAYRFHSISLVVLLQRITAEMDPVLRAEWERAAINPPGPHAQPHWHIYQTAVEHFSRTRWVTIENDEWRTLGDDLFPIEDVDVARPEQQNVARMHFAMASRWHARESNAHYQEPTSDGVAAWVSGCLEYTRAQLTHISHLSSRNPPF